MNKGPVGVIELNRRLQKRLVPAQAGLPSVTVGEKEFRLGDRVCQRVNNYNLHEAEFSMVIKERLSELRKRTKRSS